MRSGLTNLSTRQGPTRTDPDKNHRILVVDDNEAIHNDFRKILGADASGNDFEAEEARVFGGPALPRLTPFELDFAHQGAEALQLVQAAVAAGRRYAMVFMDVRMPPGWDGLQTTMKVWEVDPDLQIVICTAYSDYSWEEMMQQIDFPERLLILKKPFDTIEVLQLAQALTEKWSLLQAARQNTEALESLISERTVELRKINTQLAAEIVERKWAEEQARGSEREQRDLAAQLETERARLAAAQTVAKVGGWETNLSTNTVVWSAETYRIFETDPDQFEPSCANFCQLVHPDDRAAAEAALCHTPERPAEGAIEHRIVLPSGGIKTVEQRWKVVSDEQGQATRVIGTCQDITERKRSEEELLRSVERFRCFTRATSQIIWQTDPTGNVLEDLPTWRAYTGQSLEETFGTGWTDCIHPEDRAPTERRWTECIASKKLFEVEYRLRGSDGIYRLFLVRGVPVLDPKGAIREWVGTSTDITARKEAEQVLAESERRFRFLNDLGDATRNLSQPKEIMATVTRLLGTHLRVSRCAYAEVGKDGDQFTVPGDYTDGCSTMAGEYRLSDFGLQSHSKMAAGRTFVLRDVDAELTVKEGANAFNAIAVKAMIACPLIKNGELLAAMAVHHLAPRQWTDGDISLVQEVVERCWSIIERARAELVLRESEEHLGLVIAASNDGIFEHDFVTDILTWSDRMYEMLGLDRRSFTPSISAFMELVHPDDRATFEAALSGQMVHGGRYDAHTRVRRRDGSYGDFLSRGRVLLDAAGRPTRIVGSMADLTSLLEAEQKLVEQAKLLNLAQDAIMVRDMDDRVEFWNHGAESLYGWTAEEVRGRLSADFLHQEDPAAVLAADCSLFETGAWSGECRHMTKQGGTVIVRSRWTLVRDEHGKPKSKLVINTDITEQKKIEEQFLRAQRLESIGTLASGVAHDLNNILLPIMMAAPILREEMDPNERDKFLDIVEGSAKRGAEIIKQVLTFARGADGDHILLQPIYLLEEVANIASQTFPKTITLRTDYDESIRSIEAEPTQLHQVLLNLCINARDAMPNGGQLSLTAENFDVDELYARVTPGATAGPHVVLQVTDTGIGIPSDVIDKIFDPFFTTKGVGEGTGLGLSTVAGIVKSHGGFLELESKPGRTAFKVFLPAKEPIDGAGLAPAEPAVPGGEGQTILVVDDEPSIREVAQLILESHGYKVLVAEDGPEAIALFAQQAGKIAAVVTDLAMPLMNGLMLVRALHRIEPGIKIIISTGRNDDSQKDEMIALKIDGCLLKPFTTRELLIKLNQVLHSGLQDAA